MVKIAKRAFLFPGQGAQYVGMGKELCRQFDEAKRVYQKANDVLGFDLASICFNGHPEELNQTSMCQPAILVTSIAALESYKNCRNNGMAECHAVAGLSLGEYTALVFAGSLSFEDAVQLVYKRGKFMQEACNERPGGMVSILGLDDEKVEEICKESGQFGHICAANYNCPGQVVLSGEKKAIEKASSIAKEKGARVIPLQVNGAFHSNLMASACEKVAIELEKVKITDARIPVVANVTGRYIKKPEEIKASLIQQLASPVRWYQSMRHLIQDGFEEFYEFGPGKVLSGLLRRIDSTKSTKSLETVQSFNS
ncbi:MAG: ACP S-malonyltransferase [Candidatus Brocadiales bacterium]